MKDFEFFSQMTEFAFRFISFCFILPNTVTPRYESAGKKQNASLAHKSNSSIYFYFAAISLPQKKNKNEIK